MEECKMGMLRDYQMEICHRVAQAFGQGRSVMVQMPTGTGKTWVLAALVERWRANGPGTKGEVLLVAHRRELVEQMEDTVQRVLRAADGGPGEAAREGIHIRSIQWLSRHLDELAMEPALVVVDEAHHALAATYRMLWQRWPKARFLGLTATPYRMNGEGFTDLFEELVTSWSIRQFQAAGWLAGYVYYSIRPDSEEQALVDSLRKRGADGDFQTREMAEKLDGVPSLRRLYEAFRRHAAHRKGLVYAIDIAHAEHIAAFYRERGVRAEAVSSRTPAARRRELVAALREDRLQVLVNVDLFSEGFDCPDVGFVQLARPTLSLAKFLQMVGRGLRIHAGKEDCVLLDNVGLYRRFGLPSADRDWRLFFSGAAAGRGTAAGAAGREAAWGWIPSALLDETDEPVVRIASFERGQGGLALRSDDGGFEPVKRAARGTGWRDCRSGVVFASYPTVVDYGGIELATDDGLTFFPRIRSPWIDGKAGVNRKTLETQPYQGISWHQLYIPFNRPDRVFRLVEMKANWVRLYEDEEGKRYVQKDLDHGLMDLEEVGDWNGFMRSCEEELRRDGERQRVSYRLKVMNPGFEIPSGVFPEGAVFTRLEGQLCRVSYQENGGCRECWIDLDTGYRHLQKPYLFQRSFLRLLREGDRVFIRNIREEAGVPYRNWQVRCDRDFCTVGDSFYFADQLNGMPYRIKKRSEDFRMFVLEGEGLKKDSFQAAEDLMVINQPDKPLELSAIAVR